MGQAPLLVTSLVPFHQETHWNPANLQVSPVNPIGIHLLLKYLIVCISRLGVKIAESF